MRDEQLLDEAAAAVRCRMSHRTMQRWRSTGDGPPYIRVGPRLIAYRQADVEAWLRSRTFKNIDDEVARCVVT